MFSKLSTSWLRKHLSDRRVWLSASLAVSLLAIAILLSPAGCHFNGEAGLRSTGVPVMRVLLASGTQQVILTAREAPVYKTGSDPTQRLLNLPPNQPIPVVLTPGGWRVGGTMLGTGVLTLQPVVEGSLEVLVDGNANIHGAYRGQYRLVPTAPGRFDLINDVDVDSYLLGVLAKELLPGWHEETYKAQAIVARTYALWEKAMAAGREYDVFTDTRSQVYGGMAAETTKSRNAVTATQGIVVVYGAPGEEKIFHAYFSSCCGGVTQSAADAFGDPYSEPLSDQNNRAMCNAAPSFNWGPIVIRKDELTRRIRLWASRQKHPRPERDMAMVASVAVQWSNPWGRPTRFMITDVRGTRYSLNGEEMRWSVNTDAENNPDKSGAPTTLKSSFVKVINDADSVRFVEGHGWGHGVGMCQWCSQRRAEEGMQHEDIVLVAYPNSKLARAY